MGGWVGGRKGEEEEGDVFTWLFDIGIAATIVAPVGDEIRVEVVQEAVGPVVCLVWGGWGGGGVGG